MAVWRIVKSGNDLLVTRENGCVVTKPCGRAEVHEELWVTGWVIEHATAFDEIRTEAGVFVRQVSPKATLGGGQ